MQHCDYSWQVSGHQISPHDAGLLPATGEVVERVVQSGGNVRGQRPGAARRGQKVAFPCAQRYCGVDQLSEAFQRICGVAYGLDRRREALGDALIQGGPNQLSLGGEPSVERALADPGPAGDCLDGRLGTSSPYTSRAARRIRSALRAASARNGRSDSADIGSAYLTVDCHLVAFYARN